MPNDFPDEYHAGGRRRPRNEGVELIRRARLRAATVAVAAAVVTALPVAVGGFTAAAAPTDPIIKSGKLLASPKSANGSKISSFTIQDGRNVQLQVHSVAMNQDIEVNVQRPRDASKPRPSLYLLSGAGGGQDSATWQRETDALAFLSDKNVNVIQPVGGKWSYYADWRAPDPALGVNKWQTFFTEELPPLIDGALGTTKTNALAGLSTSGTSVLQLPIVKPGLFKSIAAYSGCAQISDPIGYQFVKVTVETWGGGNTLNMYGPQNDPMWAAHDPYVHAAGLRGTNIFLSTGSGVPGMYDTVNSPFLQAPGVPGLANQVIVGGAIEAGVNYCAHNLQAKLNQLNIPATYDFQPTGTHSWGYWQDALKKSWPVLAKGLALPA